MSNLHVSRMLKQQLHKLFLFACLSLSNTIDAQSIKQLLKQGTEATNRKDFSAAAQIYNQIILQDSSNIEYQLLFADASRLNFDNDVSLHWYQKIYKKDNGKTYKEIPFYIAMQLKTNGSIKKQKSILINITKNNVLVRTKKSSV